jgi:CubicO group peptidase (beta-lactamase class C family)
MLRWTFSLLALLFLAAPVLAQKAPAKLSKDDLRALLEKHRKKYDMPALGAAVVSSKGLQVLAVTGVRKRGTDVAVQEGDCFHLGSDTKAMTATLIALLVQKKQLSYDQTLGKSFPELAEKMPAELRPATLLHLLTHRAGLKANLPWWFLASKLPIREQRQKAVEMGLKTKPESKPGDKYHYSNLGYVVAAVMAERATKQSWEELLAQHVAKPLKLTTLGHGAMGSKDKIDQPWPHNDKGKPVEPGPMADNPPVMGPAGNVHCSLEDWARFIADQLKGAAGKDGLLKAQAYRKLFEPANKGENYTPGGFLYISAPRGAVLMHAGSNTMNYCEAVLVPRLDLAILVVCNQGGDKAEEASQAAREAVLRWVLK